MSSLIKKIIVAILFFFTSICCSNKTHEHTHSKKQTSSLKNTFHNDFFIGAAINQNQILGQDSMAKLLLKKEFNSITSENNLKWMYIEPSPNNFNFVISDKFVALGEKNNMHIVGHTLVWHSQIADYMNEITDSVRMANYMESHIRALVGRYKNRIHSWDVVNEALNEDGSLRESIFYSLLGEEYIENAFRLAAEVDPKAELTYNDYNLCKPSKREGVIKLVQNIQKNGAKIDAVGIQAHWNLNNPPLDEIEKTILAFSKLGVKVMFTELDVSVLPNPWELEGVDENQNFQQFEGNTKMNPYPLKLPDSIQVQLTKRYEQIFALFLKHQEKISRVTFWGISDKQSWLNNWPIKGRTNYPLLFDREYQKKDAYMGIINQKKQTQF
jgi:endo-1,4-beta-xylanase